MALGYGVLGALWILLSDWAAGLLVSPEHLRELQTLKGWLFVGVTGALLWVVLHGYSRARIRAEEAEARASGASRRPWPPSERPSSRWGPATPIRSSR